jgi:hypothetical protein
LAIGSDDKIVHMKSPPGAMAHRKCIRKTKKMAFQGISPEEMSRRLAAQSN